MKIRFRLRTLFIATALVAVGLFVGSHVSISGHWQPAAQTPFNYSTFWLRVEWNETMLLDTTRIMGPHPDGVEPLPYFHFHWFGQEWFYDDESWVDGGPAA